MLSWGRSRKEQTYEYSSEKKEPSPCAAGKNGKGTTFSRADFVLLDEVVQTFLFPVIGTAKAVPSHMTAIILA